MTLAILMVMLSMAGAPQLDGLYRSARAYDKKTFRYRVPEDGPLRRIQTLVARVARAVAPGPPPDLLVSAARSAGLELVLARDPAGEVWVLHEPGGQHAGAGLYAFRAGVAPLCIQAPHTFFDEGTGEIALQLFARLRAGALFVNTVHRYARSDGGSSAADVAHSERTMFAAATHGLYDAGRWDLVQVHGFGEREELPANVKAVVSDGTSARPPGAPAERLRAALTRRWGEGTVRLFGVDAQVLGATTNVQGKAARAAKAVFLHVEMSATTRQTLGQDPGALADAIVETLGAIEALMLVLALLVAASVPAVLTEVSPALALRWRSLGSLHLQSDATAEVELRASPVLRLEASFGAGCRPRFSRRFGGVDVPLPSGDELTVVLPPALAPTEERDGQVEPALVGLRLPAGCPATDARAYEAATDPDPYAGRLVVAELRGLLEKGAPPEELARWLAAPHPHRWQEEAALALAVPALGGPPELAAGLLEQATAPVRAAELAFARTNDLSHGKTRSLAGGDWMSVAVGAHVDLDVTGQDLIRLGHRAVAPGDDGASPAWRFSVAFDDDPAQVVLAHAPIDPSAPDVAMARTTTLVVPPGARRLRVQAGQGAILIAALGIHAKGALVEPFHRSAADWLERASAQTSWWGRLAAALLHPRTPELSDGPPLLALALAGRTDKARLPTSKPGGSPLERAVAGVVDAMIARRRAARAVAAGNPGQAVSLLLDLAARRPLCDEDAEALLDADAFAEESLSAHPQALLAVDGLLARRPLDRALTLARQHAFRGAARWEELSVDPGGRVTSFLDPQPADATLLAPEHARFVPVVGEQKVVLAAPPLPGHLPLLGLVAVRHPGQPVLTTVRIDGQPVTLPSVGPLERLDVPLEPGRHQVAAGPGVLVNWASGAGPRWRRYLDVGPTPLPLHNRDLGPGEVLLVAVRVVASGPVAPFSLVVAGEDSPALTLPVRPGHITRGAGELDPDVGTTDPVEVILPVSGTSASFTVATRGVPAGVRVLVHVAARCRAPVAARERPLPPLAPGIAAALARDQGRANLDAIAEITRQLDGEPGSARAWLVRAAALAGIDQPSLAREDLVRAVGERSVDGTTRRVALALWRHLEKSGSSTYPETIDRRSARQPIAFARAPVELVDDRPALRTLDAVTLRARGGELAVLAAARRAERDDDAARAAALWHALGERRPRSTFLARAGAALLALPPDPIRDVSAYIDLHRATLLDPHDRVAARLLRRAAARTRLRPVHQVDDSAGSISVEAATSDPFDSSVESALLPAARPGDLVTASRQLTLSFDLTAPMTVRLSAVARELRPAGAAALGSAGISLVWAKDGEPGHPIACAGACRGPLVTLPAGAHSLQVRLEGGLRAAARVQVTPVSCGGPCGRSPFEHSADYLVARPEQPVVVTLFGPAVIEAELRAPAGLTHQVSVAIHPGPGGRRVLLPANDPGDRRLVAFTGNRPAETSVVETLVLERRQTYRLALRPDRGAVMCRLLVREAGEGASTAERPPATLRAEGPPPLLAPPDLIHALHATVVDGDVAPGWDDLGALTVELGYRTAVDLADQSGQLARRRAALAAVTYRRMFEGLHLTLKVGGEARLWQDGSASQAGNVDLYFLHPAVRWLRLFASVDGVTQPVDGQQASALAGQLTVEPIVTPAAALHLVSKLGLGLQYQSLERADESLVDPDLFSSYAAHRPRVLFWEEDIELEPLTDLLIFGGGRLTTRSDLDLRHPDHASASIVARTVFGRFFVEAGFRWSWFFPGADRASALVSRRASLSLLHTIWLGHKNALLIGVQAAQHIDQHAPEVALRLGWELSNGRRLQDHTPVEGENYFYPARGPGRESARLDVASP